MLEPSRRAGGLRFHLAGVRDLGALEDPGHAALTTRVCHSKTVVRPRRRPSPRRAEFQARHPGRVMIPAYAKPAHRRLRQKLAEIAQWNDAEGPNVESSRATGARHHRQRRRRVHAREAAPGAGPQARHDLSAADRTPPRLRRRVERVMVIEEGDPVLVDRPARRRHPRRGQAEMFRFGELDVERVRRILAGDTSARAVPRKRQAAATLPRLPPPRRLRDPARARLHRRRRHRLLHARRAPPLRGDGHLRLHGRLDRRRPRPAARPAPGAGAARRQRHRRLDLRPQRHHRPGRDGLQPAATGHVVLILDNGTTAMTGLQEHPGTGRLLDHSPPIKLNFEETGAAPWASRTSMSSTPPRSRTTRCAILITNLLARNRDSR
jgi:indolepyruvate ferredoxin oxidoreductase, alpha subunit